MPNPEQTGMWPDGSSGPKKLEVLPAGVEYKGYNTVPVPVIPLSTCKELVEAARPYVENAAPHEQVFSGEDLRNFERLKAALSRFKALTDTEEGLDAGTR